MRSEEEEEEEEESKTKLKKHERNKYPLSMNHAGFTRAKMALQMCLEQDSIVDDITLFYLSKYSY